MVFLSVIYFIYFALLGLFLPYWPLFLKHLGFSFQVIGYLMALLYFTKVIAPSVWGWLADNKIDRVKVVQLGTFLSLASFSLVFLSHSLILLACMMFLFSFFWNAILPQLEAITLSALQENPDRYSKIRLWGSIGFIAATMGGGYYLDRFGIHYLPTLCFCGAGLLAACTFGLKIKGRTLEARARKVDRFRQYFKCREVWCFILVCFFMQLSFGPYYSFMSILLEGNGHSKTSLSAIWSFGVVAEILLFLVMPTLVRRVHIHTMIGFALLVAAIRWFVMPWIVGDLILLLAMQITHAITFAMFHSCCIAWVHRLFPNRLWGQGMALYSTASYGVGGAIGSVIAGLAWGASGAHLAFCLAAINALIGFILLISLLKVKT